MPPTTLKTMPRSTTTIHAPAADNISLGEFIVDEDVEHFNSTLWQTFDQNAFILQQRDALEAFNVEKALRLSKETAAAEQQRRQTAAITAPAAGIPSSNPSSSRHVSQPIAIKKGGATPHPLYPSSSPAKPINFSPSSSSSSYHLQDKKASASIAKQHSRNQLSLSTSSFPNSSFPSPSAAVDSRHSRSTSQSNTLTKAPSLLLSPSIAPPVANQRTISKREPGVSDEPTRSIPSSQTSDATHPKRRRTEGKPSVSSPPVDVVVSAPPLSAPQKSSRTLRTGTIIASTKDNSSSSISTSEGSQSHPPSKSKPNTAPKQKAYLHNPFSDIQTCPRCGNRSTRNQH